MWENLSESEEPLCRELRVNGNLSVTQLSKKTNYPTWKVSRILKRLEIRGIVRHEVEDRKRRGRPRKFYELTLEMRISSANGGGSRE